MNMVALTTKIRLPHVFLNAVQLQIFFCDSNRMISFAQKKTGGYTLENEGGWIPKKPPNIGSFPIPGVGLKQHFIRSLQA